MATKTLLIMRHAKSDWGTSAMHDFDRPLSKRGRRDAPRMGRWLQRRGYEPDRIICSPALRTRETAEQVVVRTGYPEEEIIYEPAIYECGLRELLGALRAHAGNADCLMIIGHNPGLDQLALYLADRPPPRTETGKLMTTAAVAVLRFEQPEWLFAESSGELVEIMRPGEL